MRRSIPVLLLATTPLAAHAFDPGSSGTDGALDLTGQSGEVLFNPAVLGIDADRDNVFHFTSVNIPEGVTLRMRDDLTPGPVHWLVQGDVVISGVLDLSGEDGVEVSGVPNNQPRAIPGPGGYAGGLASDVDELQDHVGADRDAAGAGWFVTRYLYPLRGGNGKDGSSSQTGPSGGGAIMIASATKITLDGVIDIQGGKAATSDSWAGAGAIRLLAPNVDGAGEVVPTGRSDSHGMYRYCPSGTWGYFGVARIEATTTTIPASRLPGGQVCTQAGESLFGPFLVPLADSTPLLPSTANRAAPVVRIDTVDGAAVTQPSNGAWAVPDGVIDSADPVDVVIKAERVPLGTSVKVIVACPDGFTAASSPDPQLAGTFEDSTATVSMSIPSGLCQVVARAEW